MTFSAKRKWKTIVLAALALVPCGVAAPVLPALAEETATPKSAIIPFETLGLGNKSGCEKRAMMPIADEAEWKRVWGVHTSVDSNAPEMPKVDFEKQTALALLAGKQATAKNIQIAQIVRGPRETVVFYLMTEEEPEWGQPLAIGPSQPFHFAVVDKIEGPIRFVDALTAAADCRTCPA